MSTFKCGKCNEIFTTISKYITHKNSATSCLILTESKKNIQNSLKLRKERKFKCERCGKTFGLKKSYDYHVYNKKRPCIKLIEPVNDGSFDSTYEKFKKSDDVRNKWCVFCDKNFSSRSHLLRHQYKNCKVIRELKSLSDDPDVTIEQLRKEFLKKEFKTHLNDVEYDDILDKLLNSETDKIKNNVVNMQQNVMKDNVANVSMTNNYTNYNNTIIQNITCQNTERLPFGSEDVSHISNDDKRKIMNNIFNKFPALMEDIHFNKEKPENMNIYLPNINMPFVKVYDGERWLMSVLSVKIKELLRTMIDLIDEYVDEMGDNIPEFKLSKYMEDRKICLAFCNTDVSKHKHHKFSEMFQLLKATMCNFKNMIEDDINIVQSHTNAIESNTIESNMIESNTIENSEPKQMTIAEKMTEQDQSIEEIVKKHINKSRFENNDEDVSNFLTDIYNDYVENYNISDEISEESIPDNNIKEIDESQIDFIESIDLNKDSYDEDYDDDDDEDNETNNSIEFDNKFDNKFDNDSDNETNN